MKLTVKTLRTHREKAKGLMGVNPVYPIYFTTRWGIHTFGMKVPIDVVILDEDFCVAITKRLPPNRIFFWNPNYRHVVELPEGEINKKGINVGCTIYLYP